MNYLQLTIFSPDIYYKYHYKRLLLPQFLIVQSSVIIIYTLDKKFRCYFKLTTQLPTTNFTIFYTKSIFIHVARFLKTTKYLVMQLIGFEKAQN